MCYALGGSAPVEPAGRTATPERASQHDTCTSRVDAGHNGGDPPADRRRELVGLLGREALAGPDALGQLVARPASYAGVAGVLRLADAAGLPLGVVGGAADTPGAGSTRPAPAGLVLDLSRLSAVLEVQAEDMLAVVQAGATVTALAAAAVAVGLDYPPACLASRRATVGGSLARGGGRRPGWGPHRDHVLGLRAALPGGELVAAGSRAIKNATGYSLTQALLGARGALGVVVEATLRLAPRPRPRRTSLLGFPDAGAAARAALALLAAGPVPATAELLDRRALDAGCPRLASLLPAGAGAALLLLFEGTGKAESPEGGYLGSAPAALAGATAAAWLDAPTAAAAWDERRELAERLGAGRPGVPGRAWLELALPLAVLPAFVGQARALADRRRADLALAGGVAAGSLEVHLLDAVDVGAVDEAAGPVALARELVAAARAAGGHLADADGLGLGWEAWLDLALPPTVGAALRQVKAAVDPRGVLRPVGL